MIVNFNTPFVDCFNKPIDDKTIGETLALRLFNASTIEGKQMTAEQKYMAHTLSRRIATECESVRLTAEEAAFIKAFAVDIYNAGAYGQIVDLIEEPKTLRI